MVPLVSESESVPLIRTLNLTLAARNDHYSDFGSSTNPKIGLEWMPFTGLTARTSYSRSFRPPLLNQISPEPEFYTVLVTNPASATHTTDTLVNQSPHNANLRPERSKSYTAGFDFRPTFAPGFALSGTWFRTDYSDRIAVPPVIGNIFAGTATIYQQPLLSPYITFSPPMDLVNSIFNGPGWAGDKAKLGPAGVQAYFNDQLTNIAATVIEGLEAQANYPLRTQRGTFDWSLGSTYYLSNTYKTTPGAPSASLVNIIGEPLRLRVRGGLSWAYGGWGSSAFVNYSNGYTNPLFTPYQPVASWTTLDFQLTYRFIDHLGFNGRGETKLALSVLNLFDRDPPFVAFPKRGNFTGVGFDPLNATAVGRVVALQVTKGW
jgi:outer membrane receptor protein involved in Fe transport